MKPTDYAPRAAEFDSHLNGINLIGAEIGVDVGAHCEAMLLYADIKHITLVDIWDKEYYHGYCCGRLRWYRHRITMIKQKAEAFEGGVYDFIYFDLPQTYDLTMMMLRRWSTTPLIGYRGAGFQEVLRACKEFASANKREIIIGADDIIIKK